MTPVRGGVRVGAGLLPDVLLHAAPIAIQSMRMPPLTGMVLPVT